MRQLAFAGKSLLIGDAVADALIGYAAHLGRMHTADEVTIRALSPIGREVRVQLLLNSGSVLALESTESTLPEPDNVDVTAYMLAQRAHFDLHAQVRDGE